MNKESYSNNRGIIFNIQRFSIHDGNGIRTNIFFKGCPLRCIWCSNPESQTYEPQHMYNADKCILCGECAMACAGGHLVFSKSTGPVKTSAPCTYCRACESACVYNVLYLAGKYMTIDEIIGICSKDIPYYNRSGGGVTLSGGEPFMQGSFAVALLCALKSLGINTAVETTGYADYDILKRADADMFLYDFKCFDPDMHKALTGVSNETIKNNLRRLLADGRNVIVRLPVIPGLNADDKNIDCVGRFLHSVGVKNVHIIPYHSLGSSKYAMIGRTYTLTDTAAPTDTQISTISTILKSYGLNVSHS